MMTLARFLRVVSPSLFIVLGFACGVVGQTETATVSGLITDRTGATVPGAEVRLQSVERGTVTTTTTNDAGIYVFPSVHPGQFQISVHKQGFKQVDLLGLIVNVQDHIEQNFHLDIGSVAESVTVEGGAPLINTTDAAVSTVLDRQFAENLPLNGRSFQTLIQLTPGVVLTPTNVQDSGQFSVNGQRASSNYWMVDGVSANVGISTSQYFTGNGLSGANAGFSVLGGTNSLVSVDALQEFRIQTSTFAPEFGRTPGGQISIVTRSGTNQWHGSAFDYLRNDIFDANNWFADAKKLAKPEERQNDFGGTFSGPIFNDRTFFFFSYEGLRLRLPQTAESLVPDLTARQTAIPAMQPFLNAFPLPSPNTPDDTTNEIAQFNASYSNSATLDAYSLRIDHKLSDKWSLFGRYNYSPSAVNQRGSGTLSSVTRSQVTLETGTLGATWAVAPTAVNDLRFNYSQAESNGHSFLDGFGGAVPLAALPFPNGFSASNGFFGLTVFSLGTYGGPSAGSVGDNVQRQINIVDNLNVQKGAHNLKFGLDFRRISPDHGVSAYQQAPTFLDVPSASSGDLFFGDIISGRGGTFHFHNLGVFAQDTWRMTPRLTVTYGLRWDVDFAPSSSPALLAATGFNLSDVSTLALAPAGTPPFQTTYGNVAPRIGVAYLLRGDQKWQTVLRGGFGVFYDLATSEAGNLVNSNFYPFGATEFRFGPPIGGTSTFPFSSADATPPAITISTLSMPASHAYMFDPHLELPYTLEWNFTVEQALGAQQTLSVSYIGSAGRRLLQTVAFLAPNKNFGNAQLVTNAATSDYDSLQGQFQRRLSRGLQAIASYTWSHSIDSASAGSVGGFGNALLPGAIQQNRGPSDFDIRNAFSMGLTYDMPVPKWNSFSNAIVKGWSLESVVQARSALPITVSDGAVSALGQNLVLLRPNVVSGQPFYLYGAQCAHLLGPVSQGGNGELQAGQTCPGGMALNPNAFVAPTAGLQGTLTRNALRGFGATQWDFAVHRNFPIREFLNLQFRAEMFNVLNHPNFAPPVSDISNTTQFGLSTQTLGNYLAGAGLGTGALSPLYQIGGPRSIQLALKLMF